METSIRVECYSGTRYGERPVAFALGEYRHVIQVVEKSWRTPSALHFRVRTDDGERFELAYRQEADQWSIIDLSMEAQED